MKPVQNAFVTAAIFIVCVSVVVCQQQERKVTLAPWNDPNLSEQARAEAVRQSRLTKREKAEQLFKLIRIGMTEDEFRSLLGNEANINGLPSHPLLKDGPMILCCSEYGLSVRVRGDKVIGKHLKKK